MNKKSTIIILSVLLVAILCVIVFYKPLFNPNPKYIVGQKIDSLNGVYVFYNGGIGNIVERNKAKDGYNIGLKYQCVEFVKRYYYEYYHHKMPDSYGNAKDFFNPDIKDGKLNKARELLQFKNPSTTAPKQGDLIIFDGHSGNKYGHVAIVSKSTPNEIEVIQQNPGPFAPSRIVLDLNLDNERWKVSNERVLGWLRMKD